MPTYTPLADGQQPAFGTSGPAVSALQAQLNAQNQTKPGYTPLKVDGLYGPLTQSATTFSNPGIISTGGYRDGLNQGDADIANIQNDPYQQLFQRLEEQNRIAEENAIATATAEGKRDNVQQEQEFNRQRMAQESAGIVGGLSRYAPEMQSGLMNQLYQENLANVRNIQLEEDMAIAKAKQARAENDLDVMQEQLQYAERLRKEKADALMEAQKFAFEKEKFAKSLALDWATENRLGKTGTGNSTLDKLNSLFPDDGTSAGTESAGTESGNQTIKLTGAKGAQNKRELIKAGIDLGMLVDLRDALSEGITFDELISEGILDEATAAIIRPYIENAV